MPGRGLRKIAQWWVAPPQAGLHYITGEMTWSDYYVLPGRQGATAHTGEHNHGGTINSVSNGTSTGKVASRMLQANEQRLHQALEYRTRAEVYFTL